ncbi:MAG: type II CAAX endopeptidase family protein [Paracoccus sp. (in: a-proteobacteria)]|nr:type II CAAX endopeptidase family protein [Paracoccus sp. (in: a-proteobacteria)]
MTNPNPALFTNRLAARDTGWPLWYFLIAYAGLMLAGFVTIFVANPVAASVLSMLAIGVLPLAAVIGVAQRWPSRWQMGLGAERLGRDLAVALVAVLAFNALMIIWPMIAPGQIAGVSGTELSDSGFGAGPLRDLIAALTVAVLAPVFEELAFRVAIFRPLHDGLRGFRLRGPVSLGLSALIFTLPHAAPGDAEFLPYLLVALLFPAVYMLTGSLIAAIMAHAFQSCYAWAALILTHPQGADLSPLTLPLILAAPLIVLGLTLAMARLFKP